MSGFAWLDYSEHERRKALDVIDLFGEKDTRDELGIGTVRDALADRLFPGISTIQTRARYFLFIPWVHQGLGGLDQPFECPLTFGCCAGHVISSLSSPRRIARGTRPGTSFAWP